MGLWGREDGGGGMGLPGEKGDGEEKGESGWVG